ncbi:MAG: MATE family efflux transporter [Velocimicrobium sp.]
MSDKRSYGKEMLLIGVPITLQSIIQASYGLVDQFMVGRLGTVSIAGSGIGATFSSLVIVTLSAIAAVASILITQYYGSQNKQGIIQSFYACFYVAMLVMLVFVIPSLITPKQIIALYTTDFETIQMASRYLRIVVLSFFPMTISLLLSSLLRSLENSRPPMYASAVSMGSNVVFNYIFIFGKFGMPRLGLIGAGIGTLIARSIEAILLIVFLLKKGYLYNANFRLRGGNRFFYQKIAGMMIPILLNEFLWSLGENIYAIIYGRIGIQSLAAVTLTNPMQSMFIGMFTGISTAAAIMVGKRLGCDNKKEAYEVSIFILKVSFLGSVITSVLLILIAKPYVTLFRVEPEVAKMTKYLIYALAVVLCAKIMNMVLAGGIIRSGGNTRYTLFIDLIGTWIFGVPLGIVAATILKLPVYQVYFILSQEEVVRLVLGFLVFHKRKWMKNITK